jgi:hypothetical protein
LGQRAGGEFLCELQSRTAGGGIFESISQARRETFSDIEGYDNRERWHSALGYKSPEEFEQEFKIDRKDQLARVLCAD